MDIFSIVIIILAALLSAIGGYYALNHFAPHENLEIQTARAFQEGKYQEIIDLTGKNPRKRLPEAVLLALARAHARLGQAPQALAAYEKLLGRLEEKNSLRAVVYLEQGDILLKQKEIVAARGSYLLGLDSAPKDSFLRYKMALLSSETGDHKQARLILRELLKENPKLADARLLYAETLAALGFYSKAIQHYGMLDRAGEKIVTYAYAKTLKELKIIDRAISVYRALLNSRVDAHKRNEMLLDCARLYIQSSRFDEALLFIEENLPSLKGEAHLEMRYIRASLNVKRGDEYKGLQEFALLFEESPNYKDLKTIMEAGGKVLDMPFLRKYFTSDALSFEDMLIGLLPSGALATKRSSDYYVFSAGHRAFAFYRHYGPAPKKIMDDIDLNFLQYCQRASSLEFWSFSGISDSTVSHARSNYTLKICSGEAFRALNEGSLHERNLLHQLKQ